LAGLAAAFALSVSSFSSGRTNGWLCGMSVVGRRLSQVLYLDENVYFWNTRSRDKAKCFQMTAVVWS